MKSTKRRSKRRRKRRRKNKGKRKEKAKEPIKLLMGIAIVENGIMIIDMDKALKKLLIALNMKGNLIH